MTSKWTLFALAIIAATIAFLAIPPLMGPATPEIPSSDEATRHPLPPSTSLPSPNPPPIDRTGQTSAAPIAPLPSDATNAPWMTRDLPERQPVLPAPERADSSAALPLDLPPLSQHPSLMDIDDKQLMADLRQAQTDLNELRNRYGPVVANIDLDILQENLKIVEQLNSYLPSLQALPANPTPEQSARLLRDAEQIIKLSEKIRTDFMTDASPGLDPARRP